LQTSGRRFAEQILNRPVERGAAATPPRAAYVPDVRAIYLIGVLVLVLIVTFKGGFWSRLGVLALTLVIGGFWLNAQYSSEQIVALLSGQMPSAALTGVFLLVLAIPLTVLLCGTGVGQLRPARSIQAVPTCRVDAKGKVRQVRRVAYRDRRVLHFQGSNDAGRRPPYPGVQPVGHDGRREINSAAGRRSGADRLGSLRAFLVFLPVSRRGLFVAAQPRGHPKAIPAGQEIRQMPIRLDGQGQGRLHTVRQVPLRQRHRFAEH
jgi:hypothetical protein